MWGAGGFWNQALTATASVILIAGFSGPASAAPNLEYWRAPYALRVTSNDTRFAQGFLCKSMYGGFELTRNGDARNAWPLYPAISPFVPAPSPNSSVLVGNLYQDEYHSRTNSTELVLIWSSRPASADFSPMFRLSWDTGPGILHTWPALYLVSWGGWRFKWNEAQNKMLLDDSLSNRQKWWWVAYQESGDWWSLATWNGTTPAKNTGWSPDIYGIIDKHVDVEVEVVPLWTLLPSNSTA